MKFLTGKKQEFLDFLDSINRKDRVAIVSHNDLDGIGSAMLMREILNSKRIRTRSLYFINYKKGMLKKLYDKLITKRVNKIFILDINVYADYEEFENFRKDFDVFLVDHHPSEIKKERNIIKTRTEDCATFTLYEIGKEITNMDKWKWLVCATMISEFSYNSPENLEFIKEIYPGINKDDILNSIPGKFSQEITSALIFFRGKEKRVFYLLLKNRLKKFDKYHEIIEEEIKRTIEKFRKEAEYYPNKNLYFYYYTPKFSITSIVVTILSIEEKDKTFVFASDTEEEKEFVKVSSRNQSGNVDLNTLMKTGVNGLENATGGGHIKASAAMLMKKDLGRFKKNILEQ